MPTDRTTIGKLCRANKSSSSIICGWSPKAGGSVVRTPIKPAST